MAITLKGHITVELDGERFDIGGSDFSLQEERTADPGDDESLYEALFVYYDDEERFKIYIEGKLTESGEVTMYDLVINKTPDYDGPIQIITDEIFGVSG